MDSVCYREVFWQLTNGEYNPNCTSKLRKFLMNKILKCNSYEKQDNFMKEVINSYSLENIDEDTLIEEDTKQSKRGVSCKFTLFASLFYSI